jgi:hypothetical protein
MADEFARVPAKRRRLETSSHALYNSGSSTTSQDDVTGLSGVEKLDQKEALDRQFLRCLDSHPITSEGKVNPNRLEADCELHGVVTTSTAIEESTTVCFGMVSLLNDYLEGKRRAHSRP